MTAVLDTTGLSAKARALSMTRFMESNAIPMRFAFDEHPAQLESIAQAWSIGPLNAISYRGSSLVLTRGPREIRATDDELIAVNVQIQGRTQLLRGGEASVTGPNDIVVLDINDPYTTVFPDGGNQFRMMIERSMLNLSDTTVHESVSRIESSPLLTLVKRHMWRVQHSIETLSSSPPEAAAAFGNVTVDLLRTLLTTTDTQARERPDTLEAALPLRVEQYVLQNLRDSSLTRERVACHHSISARRFDDLWAGDANAFAEFLAEKRLEVARQELGSDRRRPVNDVGATSGFSDMAVFRARFEEAYGLSPEEYRNTLPPARRDDFPTG